MWVYRECPKYMITINCAVAVSYILFIIADQHSIDNIHIQFASSLIRGSWQAIIIFFAALYYFYTYRPSQHKNTRCNATCMHSLCDSIHILSQLSQYYIVIQLMQSHFKKLHTQSDSYVMCSMGFWMPRSRRIALNTKCGSQFLSDIIWSQFKCLIVLVSN